MPPVDWNKLFGSWVGAGVGAQTVGGIGPGTLANMRAFGKTPSDYPVLMAPRTKGKPKPKTKRPAAPAGAAPPTTLSLEEQASQYVDAQLGPVLAALQREREARSAELLRQQQFIQGMSGAASDLAKAFAPQVQAIYEQAAGTQGALGRGFADQFTAGEAARAADINADLQRAGAPAGQMQPGDQGGGDVIYGLGGYIPGSTFAREGAGFASAASMLPLTQQRVGLLQLRNAQLTGNQEIDKILGYIADAEAKRPGIYAETLSTLQSNEAKALQQAAENDRWEREFAFKTGQAKAKSKFDWAKLKQSGEIAQANLTYKQQRDTVLNTRWQKTFDQRAQLAANKNALPSPTLSAKLGYLVDYSGNPILNTKKQLIVLPKSGKGSMTAGQQANLAIKAGNAAKLIHDGEFGYTKNADGSMQKYPKTPPVKRPEIALDQLVGLGYPPDVARKALLKLYKPIAERGFTRNELQASKLKSLRALALQVAQSRAGEIKAWYPKGVGKAKLIQWILDNQPWHIWES